jgi:hypothetical protein
MRAFDYKNSEHEILGEKQWHFEVIRNQYKLTTKPEIQNSFKFMYKQVNVMFDNT